jgi:hypothetical protein
MEAGECRARRSEGSASGSVQNTWRAAGVRWLIPAQWSGKKMGGKNMTARPRHEIVRAAKVDVTQVEEQQFHVSRC